MPPTRTHPQSLQKRDRLDGCAPGPLTLDGRLNRRRLRSYRTPQCGPGIASTALPPRAAWRGVETDLVVFRVLASSVFGFFSSPVRCRPAAGVQRRQDSRKIDTTHRACGAHVEWPPSPARGQITVRSARELGLSSAIVAGQRQHANGGRHGTCQSTLGAIVIFRRWAVSGRSHAKARYH